MSCAFLRLAVVLVGALIASPAVSRAAPCPTAGPNLVVDNFTCQLSGVHAFTSVQVINGGVIEVNPHDGTSNKVATGNLELRAQTITIDATSRITARGAGYQTRICGDGAGPTSDAGGRGGCAVRDSGGGGAHFGRGGRGTKDITGTQQFPRDFEEDCGNSVTYSGMGVPSCTDTSNCRDDDGLPTVAGQPYVHSIYVPEFGASGGDKGCRDGDGTTLMTAGAGGGRIVLAATNPGAAITIHGTLDARGRRGCGIENDSAGGGAGGTIVVAGIAVTIGATAVITAAGGLGGDTQGALSNGECPEPFQQSGTCDDCGGGGGGGIVSVLSVTANIHDRAVFSVNGAIGGVCPICNGEAGGGVGELQISNGYVGEQCDGFDNDFDGLVDEGLPTLSCAGMTIQSCVAGVPQQCPPDVPACQAPVTDTRARFAVIVDTSGSMLLDLTGTTPTFGDGSADHPGRDVDGNGAADDSRLFQAKSALATVISAYPSVDFALARYHQDTSVDRSCQVAHNFECNAICCSYDNPTNNTGPAPTPACTVLPGPVTVLKDSPGDECINYAGNCGPPRRGADILVGFGADINNHLMWLDGTETQFDATETPGAYCDFAGGGDCELRGTGPTPLANSLQAVEDYLTPIKACDLASTGGCRGYNVILLTDGAESCQGDPAAAAAALRAKGISTFVIGFSTLPTETAQLDAIAAAGGTGTAFLVGSEDTLASIVSTSIVFETCNDLDDDCDTHVDEDFPGKGNTCDNGALGVCRTTGALVCRADGAGLECDAPPGPSPGTEICNMLDDDCDGKVDEGLTDCACIPSGEQCNDRDDDCDGLIDENLTRTCGTGTCLGIETCVAGVFQNCTADTPGTEVCNGLDDNCDGIRDGITQGCSLMPPRPPDLFPVDDPRNNPGHPANAPIPENICRPGLKTCPANVGPPNAFGACIGEQQPLVEICNGLDDDCDNAIDEVPATACTTNADCPPITPTCDNPTGTPGAGTCQFADCSTNCGVGQLICVNGVQMCNAVPAMTDDTCDGVDDDCDGLVDEDFVAGAPCGAGPPPLVCDGTEQCINGSIQCIGDPVGVEQCNCDDDDCDGMVDEGALCPAGATCTNCQCAFACSPGEFPCPLGKICAGGFCIADVCFGVSCPPVNGNLEVCRANGDMPACVSACDPSVITCPSGQVCVGATGQCAPDDCTTFPERCAANENCINGACVVNPCQGVDCAAGLYCVGGQCFASCAGVTCPPTQRCELGMCVNNPCGRPCPHGQACDDASGTCVPDPCGVVQCPLGQECNPHVGGACVDSACVGTECPSPDEVCKLGSCYDPASFLPDAGVDQIVTAGGGGGCSAGAGDDDGRGLVLGLGGVLLALARRRRRPATAATGGAA